MLIQIRRLVTRHLIRIYTVFYSALDVRLKSPFATTDMSKFRDGKIHLRNLGMKSNVASISSNNKIIPAQIYRGYSNVWSEYDFYFIEWSEKMYISFVPKARMKYTFFHFTRWNKSHIHDKHLNFLFIIYITFDRRDANLAFARESLTRSFVPWRHDVHVLFCLVTLDMTSETRIGV